MTLIHYFPSFILHFHVLIIEIKILLFLGIHDRKRQIKADNCMASLHFFSMLCLSFFSFNSNYPFLYNFVNFPLPSQ